MRKGCKKLAMLPFAPSDSAPTSPPQRARGIAEEQCAEGEQLVLGQAIPWGWVGKADSILLLMTSSIGSKACGNSSSSSFPSKLRLAGKQSETLLIAHSESSVVSGKLQYLFLLCVLKS